MEPALTRETLRDVSVEESKRLSRDREFDWPDCYDVSMAIRSRLSQEFDVLERDMSVTEVFPIDGFRHYILVVSECVLGESIAIDASFRQFSNSTDTPVNVAPHSDINDVVIVSPAEKYIFH